MRHQVSGRKLGRTSAHREAMFRNMAVSLIQHERITTTVQKAKELRVFAEKLVTLAKKNTLHSRRLAFDRLRNRDAVQKLFLTIAPAFTGRNGGYTRIMKLGTRHGDAAELAMIEYLKENLPAAQPAAEGKATTKKAAAAKPKKEPKAKSTPKAKKEAAAEGEGAVKAKAKPSRAVKAEKPAKAPAKAKKKTEPKE